MSTDTKRTRWGGQGAGLAGKDLEGLAGVTRGRRSAWVKSGLLRGEPPFTALDAAELAALAALMEAGPKCAKRAWRHCRHELREWLAAARVGEGGLWVVVDMESTRDAIAKTPRAAVKEAAALGGVHVVPVGEVARRAIAAFEDVVTRAGVGSEPATGSVVALRRRTRGN